MTVASLGAFATKHASEAVMVVALFQIGEYLQNKAINHSRNSIKKLLDFDIKMAKLKLGTEIMEVEVEKNGHILVRYKSKSKNQYLQSMRSDRAPEKSRRS